jgi:hypothetical protein
VLGLHTGCARIGYDLIDDPVPDDGSGQGATSAQSGAGPGENSGGQGGTAVGGNGGSTSSGGTPNADAGSATGGTGETNPASAGGTPAGGAGGASSPEAGRPGTGGTSGIGGIGGAGGIGGTGGRSSAGTGGRSSVGTGGRSSAGTGGRSSAGTGGRRSAGTGGTGGSAGTGGRGGSAGTCMPSESGIERCDGVDNDCSGIVDDAGACSAGCEGRVFAGTSYMYCSTNLIPSDAAAACANANMRLARIDSSAENEFIHQFVVVDTWLGGSDISIEGRWTWPDGVVFWSGVASGSAPPGMYAPFDAEEPNDNFGMSPEDCLVLRPNGYWNDKPCSTTLPFMCKRY